MEGGVFCLGGGGGGGKSCMHGGTVQFEGIYGGGGGVLTSRSSRKKGQRGGCGDMKPVCVCVCGSQRVCVFVWQFNRTV